MSEIPQEWVEKAAQALFLFQQGDRLENEPPTTQNAVRAAARAVLAAVLPDVWPCDNYQAPHTCLTAPCAKGSECDFCRAQAEAVRRAAVEEIAAAIEEECPHEDEHPEGCCEICDYAFAAAERAREIGEQDRPRRQVPSPVDTPTMHHRIARSLASPTDRDG